MSAVPQDIRPLREIEDLPGPAGLPFLGNALQIDRDRVHQAVEGWARTYGPFFRFGFGRRRFVGIADHETLMAALRERPDVFRRSLRLQEVSEEMFGQSTGVFIANGEAWRRQRRMVMAGFDPGHVKAYFPSLKKVALRLEGRWRKAARARAPIDLTADLMRYTVDAIAGLAFGADVNTLEAEGDVIQGHLDKIFPALFRRTMAPLPYWRWVRLPADRALDHSVVAVRAAVDGFIARARERMAADPVHREKPPNLLEAMIAAADRGDSGVGDREVAGNVLTMLLAGEDTTANSLAWLIHLLMRNPSALAKAQDEVRRVAPYPAGFTFEQIDALEYVGACTSEAMRLKPVAPFQLLQALSDTVVADIRIPAGTILWGLMRHDALEERHFPDPMRFDPERWLGGEGAGHGGSSRRVSMPFGGGPRICPGRYLALFEIKMAMAILLASFEIEAVDTPDGSEAREHLAITMAPTGLTMRLSERTG
jgi:cytochrome P450